MPEEATATIEAPSAPEPSYRSILESSFDAVKAAMPAEPDAPPAPAPETPAAPRVIPAVESQEIKAPAADSEFPSELLGGEKAPVETPKDELDDIQPSPKFGEAARANFDKLKAIARTAKEEAARARAEIEALRATPVKSTEEPEELKSARTKLAEMEETLMRESVRSTPKFRQLVADEAQNIADAKAYIEGVESDGVKVDTEIIDLAASLPPQRRVKALREAGLDAENIAAVMVNLSAVDNLRRQQAAAIENSKTIQTQWQAQQRAREEADEAARVAEEKHAFTEAMAEVEAAHEFLKVFPGHDKYNAQIEAIKTRAEEMFLTPKTAKEQSVIVAKGVAFDLLHRLYQSSREEAKAAKAQVAKLTAVQPAGGNGATNTNGFEMTATTPDQLRAERAAMFDHGIGR